MNANKLVETISITLRIFLKRIMFRVYVHGSLATNSFNWEKSDIDFIVVVKINPHIEANVRLIEALLRLECLAQKKDLK